MTGWSGGSYPERRLLIASGALLGMAQSLVRMPGLASVGKGAYAVSIARQASEVQHWAATVAVECGRSGGE